MSLSRQSSRNRSRLGPCPTCGSNRVVEVIETVVLTVRGERHRITDVEHERCCACGERIFGIDASKRFDAALMKRRRPRSRAA